ncbi:MAG: hypothetical protein H0T89_33915 [Deltaproteobacteria bacterium]|nr:hypothetical protein [Deltaproteobacteria bacterium]MDQ3297883.1 hypothetical protein [Myxococcota bacterium]
MKSRVPLLLATCMLLASPAARADDEVDKIMARFESEPSIRQVQVAAIEYYNVSPDTISSLRSKARRKALMPGLSIGGATSRQSSALAIDDIIYRPVGVARFEDQNGVYFGLSANLTWNLDKLVFNAEELDVMSLIGIQDGIQREVTTLYYVRRRLQIEQLLSPPSTVGARVNAELRLEELTGLLDAYTGGFFSKSVKKGNKRGGE